MEIRPTSTELGARQHNNIAFQIKAETGEIFIQKTFATGEKKLKKRKIRVFSGKSGLEGPYVADA